MTAPAPVRLGAITSPGYTRWAAERIVLGPEPRRGLELLARDVAPKL